MSYTNAALGTAFARYPDATGATIDPMGMMKVHFGGMPVFSGPGNRWMPPPGGRCIEVGLSELGGTPGFEAASAFIANPNYKGPAFASSRGYKTTADIQREAAAKTDAILAKQTVHMKTHPSDQALDSLGLPPQPETAMEPERPSPASVTPVEGLVGFRMAPREPVVGAQPLLMPDPAKPGPQETVGVWPTAAELAAQNQNPPPQAPQETLEGLLGVEPKLAKMPASALVKNLVLALDIGMNGTKDIKRMREAIAAMADAVRKGAIGD